jgi:rhamnogalacturonyl hydrolase YesR
MNIMSEIFTSKASASVAMLCLASTLCAQTQQVNDSNTPLHLMKPAYRIGYTIPKAEDVKQTMDRVRDYLERTTFAQVENKNTHEVITNYKKIDEESQLVRGTFRLTSYEWGVTYSAMLRAGEVTGDKKYSDYATRRMTFLAEVAPHFRSLTEKGKKIDPLMHQVTSPAALDDAGAICTAMIKAKMSASPLGLTEKQVGALDKQISVYHTYIDKGQYRLSDGTLARMRPLKNTVWLDDMFMGIPALAWKAVADNNKGGLDEAVRQFGLFHEKMWVNNENLYRHGWVADMDPHPSFFWGRANGWALLTACELLDALPESDPARGSVMEAFKNHLKGIVPLQHYDGAWHQLLNRNDTYLETSCTAIYAYCMAHAINKGWIDPQAYGPSAILAWNYVNTQINQEGQVCGTCVGTGMAFDPAFYAYRPVNNFAAHGYGPVIWAAAEIIEMVSKHHIQMNDSAIQFYPEDPKTDAPIFYVK